MIDLTLDMAERAAKAVAMPLHHAPGDSQTKD
jgi:hypothetical protein